MKVSNSARTILCSAFTGCLLTIHLRSTSVIKRDKRPSRLSLISWRSSTALTEVFREYRPLQTENPLSFIMLWVQLWSVSGLFKKTLPKKSSRCLIFFMLQLHQLQENQLFLSLMCLSRLWLNTIHALSLSLTQVSWSLQTLSTLLLKKFLNLYSNHKHLILSLDASSWVTLMSSAKLLWRVSKAVTKTKRRF